MTAFRALSRGLGNEWFGWIGRVAPDRVMSVAVGSEDVPKVPDRRSTCRCDPFNLLGRLAVDHKLIDQRRA